MFEGEPVPYLKSTECVLEKEEEWQVRSATACLRRSCRRDEHRAQAGLSRRSGCHSPDERSRSISRRRLRPARRWTGSGKPCPLVGKKRRLNSARTERRLNFAAFARLVVEGFQWQERVQNLVGRSEAERADEGYRRARSPRSGALLAYFLDLRALSGRGPKSADLEPAFDPGRSGLLSRQGISTYQGFLSSGLYQEAGQEQVSIVEDGKNRRARGRAERLSLLRSLEESVSFVPALDLVRRRRRANGSRPTARSRFSKVSSLRSRNVLDKPSQYHRWQVRVSREDLRDADQPVLSDREAHRPRPAEEGASKTGHRARRSSARKARSASPG